MTGLRVLHVDDDPRSLEMRASILENEFEYAVTVASNADEALSQLESAEFDCVLSDYKMPDTDGIELLSIVKERYPDLPFILFTGVESEEVAEEALANGATDYIPKSLSNISYDLLAERIDQAVTQQQIVEQLERITETPVTSSPDTEDDSVSPDTDNTRNEDVPLEVLFESPVTAENGDQGRPDGQVQSSPQRKELLSILREVFVNETDVEALFAMTESEADDNHRDRTPIQPDITEPILRDHPEPDRSVVEEDRLLTLIYEAFGESPAESESDLIHETAALAEGPVLADRDDEFFDTIRQLLLGDEDEAEAKIERSANDEVLEALLAEASHNDGALQETPGKTARGADEGLQVVDNDHDEDDFFQLLLGADEEAERSDAPSDGEDHQAEKPLQEPAETTTSVEDGDTASDTSVEAVLFDEVIEPLASSESSGTATESVETSESDEMGVVMEPSTDAPKTAVENSSPSAASVGDDDADVASSAKVEDFSAMPEQTDEEGNREHVLTHEEDVVEHSATTIRSEFVSSQHVSNEQQTAVDEEESAERDDQPESEAAPVTEQDEPTVTETHDAQPDTPDVEEDAAHAADDGETADNAPSAGPMPSFNITDNVTDHVRADEPAEPETVATGTAAVGATEEPPVEPGQITNIADLSKEQLVQLVGRLADDYSAAGTAAVAKAPDAQEASTESEPAEESDQEVGFEQEPEDDIPEPSLDEPNTESVEWTDGADYERPTGLELTPGSSFLIQCQSQDTRGHAACSDLLQTDQMAGNNVILVRYRQLNDDRLAELAVTANDMKIIAVGYQQPIPNELSDEIDVIQINNPNDLTRLGIVITGVLDKWGSASDQTMVCFDPLNILLQYKQVRNVFRFLHVLLGRLRSANAISHFHIDPTAGDPQEVSVLKPLFDDVMTIDYLGAQLD